jgi:hypothetical protein
MKCKWCGENYLISTYGNFCSPECKKEAKKDKKPGKTLGLKTNKLNKEGTWFL